VWLKADPELISPRALIRRVTEALTLSAHLVSWKSLALTLKGLAEGAERMKHDFNQEEERDPKWIVPRCLIFVSFQLAASWRLMPLTLQPGRPPRSGRNEVTR
jgi:hypothetical protein